MIKKVIKLLKSSRGINVIITSIILAAVGAVIALAVTSGIKDPLVGSDNKSGVLGTVVNKIEEMKADIE